MINDSFKKSGYFELSNLSYARNFTIKIIKILILVIMKMTIFLSSFSDMPFPIFIQSLLIATRRFGKLRSLRYELIQMLSEYKDCVKACEHQHSKRNGYISSHVYAMYPREIICKYLHNVLNCMQKV